MSIVTAAEAAERLGVTRRRVSDLWRDGALRGRKLSSGALLIELDSVMERQAVGAAEGKPWTDETVWSAVVALSDGARGGAGASADTIRRIRRNDAAALARRIRAAVAVRRYDVRRPDEVRADLALTGASAIGAISDVIGDARELHGYALVDRIEDRHDLVPSDIGNVVIHELKSGRRIREVPAALIAADAAGDLSTRVRSAALAALEEMRQPWLE